MTDLFEDKENGGYFLTASDAEVLITRPKETYDGAIPSGNSAAAVLLVQLAQYTCDVLWQEARERQIRYLAGSIKEYPAGHSFGLLALIKVLYPARELVCVSADNELPESLRNYLMENNPINLSVILKTKANEAKLETALPYVSDYPIPGKGAMYYLCKNGVCMAPVEDISKLH